MSDAAGRLRKKTPAAIWRLRANELEAELKKAKAKIEELDKEATVWCEGFQETKAKLVQCQENSARTHMDVAEKLAEIGAWVGHAGEQRTKIKLARDTISYVIECRELGQNDHIGIPWLKDILEQLREH